MAAKQSPAFSQDEQDIISVAHQYAESLINLRRAHAELLAIQSKESAYHHEVAGAEKELENRSGEVVALEQTLLILAEALGS